MLNRAEQSEQGFTLVEVVVALVILSVAVLGLSGSAAGLGQAAARAELRALAMESVQDRISRVRLDPRYGDLDSIYSGVDTNLLGIAGLTRTTTVTHVLQTNPVDLDYKRIHVVVSGAQLGEDIGRYIIIAPQ